MRGVRLARSAASNNWAPTMPYRDVASKLSKSRKTVTITLRMISSNLDATSTEHLLMRSSARPQIMFGAMGTPNPGIKASKTESAGVIEPRRKICSVNEVMHPLRSLCRGTFLMLLREKCLESCSVFVRDSGIMEPLLVHVTVKMSGRGVEIEL